MFEPIGETRPLPFPLKDQVTNGNTITPLDFEAGDFIWPEDSTERTLLPLWVSLDEWVAISSAVDVGADIAYPEQYIEVIMMLMRQTAYKVPICSLIIECIMNDADTKQAIIDALTSSDEFNTFISEKVEGLTTGQITGPLIAGSCDDAVIAGKMMALVTALDINNRDALETIEAATNDEELIGDFLEMIPVAGELPFGDLLIMAQDVLEDFAEEYDAVSTTERKEALARDLWCLAKTKEECAVSYGDLYVFFNDRISASLTLGSLIGQLLLWVASRDFETDDAIFDGMMFLQIASLRMGGRFFGVNMPKIGALTRDAEPSSIWEEWEPCEPVPPDPTCIDLTEIEALWSIYLAIGEFEEGVGFKALNYSGNYYVYVQRAPDGTSNLFSRVKLTYTTPVTHINLGTSAGTYSYTGAAATEIIYDVETFPLWTDGVANSYILIISNIDSEMTSATSLIEACIEFYEP